uniref:L-dopachrome isomerase n=1 Tax=Erythrolobus madagascarensis TaxID=708628 RepID=A0A7S0T581_9RHOD|mmetsp:Transcript_1042/g.2039  ORF Transcript_1042/g.2039 Transcript_1042/m.2039 type:complete len:116 (+) Transcript_1042:82-429(+)
MPTLILHTNVDLENKDEFIAGLSNVVSEMLGKPLQYVMVGYQQMPMMFGGSSDPCLFAFFSSLGSFDNGGPKNKEFSKVLCEFISPRLSIPADRIYIQFSDPARTHFGWNGSTFG